MSRLPSARHLAALLAAPLVFAAVACSPARGPTPVVAAPQQVADEGPGNGCDAAAAEHFTGQLLDAALGERARAAAGARSLRVIQPGMAVTLDYRPDRLNVEVDDAGRILKIHCG